MQFEVAEGMLNHSPYTALHEALPCEAIEREVAKIPAAKYTEHDIGQVDGANKFAGVDHVDDEPMVELVVKALNVLPERLVIARRAHPTLVQGAACAARGYERP